MAVGSRLASECSGRKQIGPGWTEALTSLLLGSFSQAPSLIRLCLVPHRALLKKLGGLFLPPEANSLDSSEGVLARAVVCAVSAPSGCIWGQARVQGPDAALALTPTFPYPLPGYRAAAGQWTAPAHLPGGAPWGPGASAVSLGPDLAGTSGTGSAGGHRPRCYAGPSGHHL